MPKTKGLHASFYTNKRGNTKISLGFSLEKAEALLAEDEDSEEVAMEIMEAVREQVAAAHAAQST